MIEARIGTGKGPSVINVSGDVETIVEEIGALIGMTFQLLSDASDEDAEDFRLMIRELVEEDDSPAWLWDDPEAVGLAVDPDELRKQMGEGDDGDV